MTHPVKHARAPRQSDPIGVFDSGVGGLSILKHLRLRMPHERFIFVADQAYVPYGGKTPRQLRTRSERIVRALVSRRAKAIVIACNTATCYAIDHLRQTFDVPFVGTVPAVKPACARSERKVVAVLCTPATARSRALKDLIARFGAGCRVTRIGCFGLEETVERGVIDGPQTCRLLDRYLARADRAGADALVLGCTHYPFLARPIRLRSSARLVDSGAAVARRARAVLREAGLLRIRGRGAVSYRTTADPRAFSRVAAGLLSEPVHAHRLNL